MNITDDNILKIIAETNEDTYLVGGYVRDFFMNKNSLDRDIVVKNAQEFSAKLSEILKCKLINLDEKNQIFRLILNDKKNYIDITEMVGNSIEDDLQRRDFTINAIAYDLKNKKFIDTLEGISDIKNKKLKGISEKNFTDDPLRILRAFRFKSVTGFEFDDNLKNWIQTHKNLILMPATERINYELMKLLGGDFASETLLIMDKFEILTEILPILNDVKKVTPNSHHHLDLLHHSIETVRNIELFYKNSNSEIKKHLDRNDFGGFPRINHLKLAGLLHDIGKFSTWTIDEKENRHRFIKHEEVGAKLCVPILKSLKFSKKQTEYIALMIKNHIYPSSVIANEDLTEKIMMRYIRKMEDNVIDNILIAKSDRLSAKGPAITEDIINNNISGLNKLLEFYLAKRETLKPLPKLLDGKEIISLKQIPQSKELGNIISKLHEAQINGEVLTKDDAIKFVLKL